ncbi:FAD-dependent oxidoreductase [Lentzea sp. NPDC034063]|uniref:NAD(P)/FAD-dependent oxidoreductase n=1 Tax=unclassified Lentzea TaxID=2643253 RepID=UPI003407C6ED
MSHDRDEPATHYEVLVVGAGAAGLAAAAFLGRCKRKVAVIGLADRANSSAAKVHNLPFAEGVTPEKLYATMEAELAEFGVVVLRQEVEKIQVDDDLRRVQVFTAAGQITGARLLLATGLDYDVPSWVPAEAWGKSVFTCPFCHASDHEGEAFAVVGADAQAVHTALLCAAHASTLTVVVADPAAAQSPEADHIRSIGGEVVVDTVADAELLSTGEVEMVTAGGRRIHAGAVLLLGVIRARKTLSEMLGLPPSWTGLPEVDREGRSQHPLIWVAGNAAMPYYLLVESMGSGIRAGISIHKDLTTELVK